MANKTKKAKQRIHQASVMRKSLKNRRRRKLLVSYWNIHGGQLKAVLQSATPWQNDKNVQDFLENTENE